MKERLGFKERLRDFVKPASLPPSLSPLSLLPPFFLASPCFLSPGPFSSLPFLSFSSSSSSLYYHYCFFFLLLLAFLILLKQKIAQIVAVTPFSGKDVALWIEHTEDPVKMRSRYKKYTFYV